MSTASRSFWLLATVAAAPAAVRAQEGTFILRSGKDTISVEEFKRSTGRLESRSLIKVANSRQEMVVAFTPDGIVTKLENRFWLATDSSGREPRQSVVVDFVGDSAIVHLAGSNPSTQRLGTKAGAVPYVNPSTALIDLVLDRARRLGATNADVPLFLLQGGQTVMATVKAISPDSVAVSIAGGEMRLALDQNGRIRGGAIPAQKISIDRTGVGVSMAVEKPDYSAPAGAPYTAENVKVSTPMGHVLAGTLTLPKGASRDHPIPAVVTITGSGPEDRDEAIPMFKGYRPFRQLADSLGRRGIAVLRMDDRGFGESGGDAAKATSADFAKDIQAGLAYLRTRPEIDGKRLGLIGHSEGGLIAPIVAKDEPALKGIVLLAGTAYTGRQILTFQLSNGIKHDTSLSAAKRDSLLGRVPTQIDSMSANVPWLKFFVDYQPLSTARQVKVPVLILNGATDQQVTPDQVPLLEKAFKDAGNKDVTAKIFPAMNHLFVHDADGFPGAYTQLPSMKVEPEVVGLVVEWLVKRMNVGLTP